MGNEFQSSSIVNCLSPSPNNKILYDLDNLDLSSSIIVQESLSYHKSITNLELESNNCLDLNKSKSFKYLSYDSKIYDNFNNEMENSLIVENDDESIFDIKNKNLIGEGVSENIGIILNNKSNNSIRNRSSNDRTKSESINQLTCDNESISLISNIFVENKRSFFIQDG